MRRTKAARIAAVWRKPCSKCGVAKPLEEFNRDRRAKDGRFHTCQPCWRTYKREYNARPEVIAAHKERHTRGMQNPAYRAAQAVRTLARKQVDPDGWRAYTRAHNRVKYARGPARNYPCSNPECTSQAYSWALDPAWPDIVRVPYGRYADDIDAYRPMCMGCNKREDAAFRRGNTS